MIDWSERARLALAKMAPEGTPKTTKTPVSPVLVVPPPCLSANEGDGGSAERRCGEMLATTVERGGDRRSESRSDRPTLNDMGLTKDESSRYQQLAAVLDGECAPMAAVLSRPHALTQTQRARGDVYPWDEAAVSRFAIRARVFKRRGLTPQDAEDLAERLHVRDGDEDDRRLCLECCRLKANGACTAAQSGSLAGADRRHEPVTAILWRCDAFGAREGLQ